MSILNLGYINVIDLCDLGRLRHFLRMTYCSQPMQFRPNAFIVPRFSSDERLDYHNLPRAA